MRIRELLASPRWRKLADSGRAAAAAVYGAAPGPRIRSASATLYIEALAAPDTIQHGARKNIACLCRARSVRAGVIPEDGGDAEAVLARFAKAGTDVDALANQLQQEGAQAFVKSWNALLRAHRRKK